MPQVTTWKHPRKKQYTENKYIHARRIKTDAFKNFKKRRSEALVSEFKDRYAKARPIRTLVDYVKFLEENKRLLSKIAELEKGNRLHSVPVVHPVKHFLLEISRVRVLYEGKKVTGVMAEDGLHEFYFHYPRLLIAHEMLVEVPGTDFKWAYFPHHRNFRFEDVVEAVADTRREHEEQVIVNRLADDNDQHLSPVQELPAKVLIDLKLQVIDAVYESRPLTVEDIGKQVLYINRETDAGIIPATVLSFTEDHAILYIQNVLPIQVKLNEIKNIL